MIKKITILISFFLLSVANTEAFLGSDSGLNLYKEIDKGMYELEKVQLDYELKGGKDTGNITENLNKKLETDGLKGCLNSGLTTDKIETILGKNDIKSLYDNISSDCKEKGLTISSMDNYMTALNKYKRQAKTRASNKSKEIYQISKVGLYTDGNIENSPFDLIVDLQEIDKIIFGEELEYEGEEYDGDALEKYEIDPFTDLDEDDDTEDEDDDTEDNQDNTDDGNNNTDDGDNNTNSGDLINDDNNSDLSNLPDGNNYVCPQNNDNSGLSPDELNNLKNDISGNRGDIEFTFRSTPRGHIRLPNTNQLNLNGNIQYITTTNGLYDEYINNLMGDYEEVNDNNQWKCGPDSFFCITIEFVTSQHKGLGYGDTKSIKEIIEMSNKHLKKSANTSLLQAKMGTNNFENILRDLDFSEMFHMGMIFSKKAPPFLKLDRDADKPEDAKEKEPLFKQELARRYKAQGLDYERKNDLSLLTQKEGKLREAINISELNPASLAKKEKERTRMLESLDVENQVLDNSKSQLLDKGALNEFYLEFLEYEKFFTALESYTESVMGYVKVLHDKPTGK